MASMILQRNLYTTKVSSMDYNHGKFFDILCFLIYFLEYSVSENGFYSSSKDTKIMHVDSTGNPARVFEGHTSAVNSLH